MADTSIWQALFPLIVEHGAHLVFTGISLLAGLALDAIRKHYKHAGADRALERLERIVNLAVHDVEQTVLPELKAAAADGKITSDEARNLRAAALYRAKSLLGKHGVKQMRGFADDLEQMIGTVIEAKVRELRVKQSMSPSLVPTSTPPAKS